MWPHAPLGLVVLAAAFAAVSGANDGGAILTMGLRLPSLRPLGAILVLAAGVICAPLLVGQGVAQTLSERLVSFPSNGGRIAFIVGLCAALTLVVALTARGLPTSLTLALIGGITGAGLGYGLPVSWHAVVVVLAFGVAAPFVGAFAGLLLARMLHLLPAGRHVRSGVVFATLTGYAIQALAYGANDGQKMLAVFAVFGGHQSAVATRRGLGTLLVVGCCFSIGVTASLRRLAGRLGRDLLVVRPVHALSAELASSVAVFGSAAAGMPVSMTQSIAGALVGAGVSESSRRVRWKAVIRLATAWVITLPGSVLLALVAGAVVRVLK